MKHILFRSLTALVLMLCAMPMMSQDCMEIFFSDGTSRKFFLRAVTEIFTSDYYNGVRRNTPDFQYVVTQDNEYVYDIATIDSITFTKFDEEQVNRNIRSAFEVINPVLDDCETIEQAEQRIEVIKSAEGVENAWTDGHQLYVKIKDWECVPFHFGYLDDDEGEEVRAVSNQEAVHAIIRAINKVTINPEQKDRKLSFVIANQNHYNKLGKYETYTDDRILPLYNEMQKHPAFIDVTYEPEPSVEFFMKDMFSKDIVWLITHGGYNKEYGRGHYIYTGECLGRSDRWYNDPTEEEKAEWKEKIDSIRKAHGIESEQNIGFGFIRENRGEGKHWYAYAVIGEHFFEDNCKAEYVHHNTIFFNTSCQSMKGDTTDEALSLVNKLKAKGLGLYLGFNNSSSHGPRAGQSYFSSMLKGNSALKAINTMPVVVRYDFIDGAELLLWECNYEGSTTDLFLFPVFTEDISDEQATSDFNFSEELEVKALTSSIDTKELKFGFVFGTDEAITNGKYIETNDVMSLSHSTDQGNVKFKVKVHGFKRGQKYYYKGYTYDGQGYNYGNTCSFTIDDEPQVPDDPHNPDDPQNPDEPTSYTACPDGNHPHLIDLGLPSGTKWACCNVGANTPEGYGDYFAWGETQPKDFYDWDAYIHCDGWDSCHDIGSDIAGTGYDAATANWGAPWRMPSQEQCKELLNNCTSEWTTQNGIKGRTFTGSNGGTIFLPAAGSIWNGELGRVGTYSYYWSSTPDDWNCGYALHFNPYDAYLYYYSRCFGQSIRPVWNK